MIYITKQIEYFFSKLNKFKKELKSFSIEINSKIENIPKLLKDFETKIFQQIENNKKNINRDRVEKAYEQTIEQIHRVFQELEERIEEEIKRQEFINDNQKYFTVMVFAPVKAGKSSLGNFFAGKHFINAPFDNPYKHIEKPIFETQESGRDTGDVTVDELGNTWFKEGVTDTTGAIQYFTLNGLRWIDLPSAGYVALKSDKKDMTKLVEKYINYTDMCIFLMNSSEPGLQYDMKYIERLNKEGQEALIVITKSDTVEEDEDDDGDIIQVHVPRKEDQRKLQEENICERLKEKYPDIDEKKYRAISISTLLANEAIKANDEQKFKDSNLDKLIDILCQKIDNAIEYKQRNPIRLLNSFITTVNEKIKPLEEELNNIINQVNEYKKSLEEKINAITKKVTQKVSEIIEEKANDWNERIIRQDISSSQLQQEVMAYSYDILHKCLNKEINETISAVIDIDNFREQSISVTKKDLKVKELQKRIETITDTYTVTEYYTVEKRTHGLEKLVHFFKKHVLGDTELVTKTRKVTTKVIDLGTNLDEFLDSLLPKLQEISQAESRENLYKIRDIYFAKNEKFAINMKNEIKILKDRLNSLKYIDKEDNLYEQSNNKDKNFVQTMTNYQKIILGQIEEVENIIKKYPNLESRIIKSFDEQKKKIKNVTPEIMIYGIYNAGKSSILNELLGEDKAKVQNIPTTDSVDYYNFNGYKIVDTPGIFAPIEHEEVTEEHLKKADIVLFVMSTNGSNEKAENYKRMKLIDQAGKKIIIVLNDKNDDLGKNDQFISEIKAKIHQNMRQLGIENVNEKYQIITVNAKRAKTGREKNIPQIIAKSGINELKQVIEIELKNTNSFKFFQNAIYEIEKILKNFTSELSQKAKGLSKELNKIQELLENINDEYKSIKRCMNRIIDRKSMDLKSKMPGIIFESYKNGNTEERIKEEIENFAKEIEYQFQKELDKIISQNTNLFKQQFSSKKTAENQLKLDIQRIIDIISEYRDIKTELGDKEVELA